MFESSCIINYDSLRGNWWRNDFSFASISMTGIRMIASQEMTPRNTGVVGTALAFGIGVTLSTGSLAGFPTWVTTIFGNSEVILTTLVAVLLNVILKPKSV